jgi:hypothetical protein
VVVDLPLAETEVPDVERLVPIIPIEAPELETPLVPAPSAADATQNARTWARSFARRGECCRGHNLVKAPQMNRACDIASP